MVYSFEFVKFRTLLTWIFETTTRICLSKILNFPVVWSWLYGHGGMFNGTGLLSFVRLDSCGLMFWFSNFTVDQREHRTTVHKYIFHHHAASQMQVVSWCDLIIWTESVFNAPLSLKVRALKTCFLKSKNIKPNTIQTWHNDHTVGRSTSSYTHSSKYQISTEKILVVVSKIHVSKLRNLKKSKI